MLFGHLFSIVTLSSFVVHALTVPVETNSALASGESQGECNKLSAELEVLLEHESIGLPIKPEDAAKIAHFKATCTPGPERTRVHSSVAAAVLATHKKLNTLKPKIQAVMVGPMGAIETGASKLMTEVHTNISSLNLAISSFIGAEPSVVYGNPSGDTQLTPDELAKVLNTFLSEVSELKDTVKHVSGYELSSALENISTDISDIKKTLKAISPDLAEKVRT